MKGKTAESGSPFSWAVSEPTDFILEHPIRIFYYLLTGGSFSGSALYGDKFRAKMIVGLFG